MTLPFDLSPMAALYMGAVFLLAAFVRGYSGFGFSALVVSASALVTNPLYFVAVVMFCEFGLTFQQWRGVSRDVRWPLVWVLLGGAVIIGAISWLAWREHLGAAALKEQA